MNLKKSRYTKTYISETDVEDVSPHGSPHYEDVQTQNEKDKRIRKEIEKTFVFNEFNREKIGFDGNVLYMFEITDNLYFRSLHNKSKNIEYTTTVNIKKAGSREIIDKSSDLEKFLLEKEFQPQE